MTSSTTITKTKTCQIVPSVVIQGIGQDVTVPQTGISVKTDTSMDILPLFKI